MPKKDVKVSLKSFQALYDDKNYSSLKSSILDLKNQIVNNNAIVSFVDEDNKVSNEHFFDNLSKFEEWASTTFIMDEGDENGFLKL